MFRRDPPDVYIEVATIRRLVQKMYDAVDVQSRRTTFVNVMCNCKVVDEKDQSMSREGAAQDAVVCSDRLESMNLDLPGDQQSPD